MLTNDVQKLEVDNVIQLIEVDGSAFNLDTLRFHAHNMPYSEDEINRLGAQGVDKNKLPAKSIWWQGQEYRAWPYELTGVESSTDGRIASPKLTVGNLDNSITSLCLAFDDLLQAKIIIHTTLKKYLDARNFSNGNPHADPTQEQTNVFYINGKTTETSTAVEFVLSTPMDLQGLKLPARQMHSTCFWCLRGWYRSGNGCTYSGLNYFDKNNQPVDDPALDECAGTVRACKKRFGEHNEIPFGGMPGTSLIR